MYKAFLHTKVINGYKLVRVLGLNKEQAQYRLDNMIENNILYKMLAPKNLDKRVMFEYEAKCKSGNKVKVTEIFEEAVLDKEIGFKLGSFYFWYCAKEKAFVNKDFGKTLFSHNDTLVSVNTALREPYNYDVFTAPANQSVMDFYNYFENSDILVCQFYY